MAIIHDVLAEYLPVKRKQTSRGWQVFDAPCCVHRGHNPDKRGRGNLLMSSDGKIGFNCYNCGFKTVYDGSHLGQKFEALLMWLNVPHDVVNKIKLELLKNQLDGIDKPISVTLPQTISRNFKEVKLPKGSTSIHSVLEWDEVPDQYVKVIEYLASRGSAISKNYDYYWSPDTKFNMSDRIIIPFYHKNNIVGWTARFSGKPPSGVPRYWNSELPSGYLFNNEALYKPYRRYIILVEGPFDAISIDGVGVLGSELSKDQANWLIEADKDIIVVPDRQKKNQGLIDSALMYGWDVAFPEWENDIKDAADATKRYGRLYTLRSIIETRTQSSIEIGIKRKMFKG